MAVTGGVN